MTRKLKMKRLLALVIAVLTVVVSVLAVNAAQSQAMATQTTSENSISTYFHKESGTLIVSGSGWIGAENKLFPADWDTLAWPGTLSVDTSVRHLVIDKGITGIWGSFNDMHNLETVSLPEGITEISDSFMNCTSLKSVDFPESLEEVGGFAFMGCSSLSNVDFKNAIKVNGGYNGAPFYNCDALKELRLPGGSYLSSAFVGCSSLENVYIGREGLEIESVCYDCIDADQVVMESFAGCNKNLKLHYVEGSLSCNKEAVFWDRVLVENMPDKVALTVTHTGININWNGKTGADVYHLYRKAKGDKSWTKIADTELTYYDDNTVKSGVEYSYLIKVDDDTDKLTSSYTRFIGTPKISSASMTSKGIKLNWNKVAGTVKYRVYRRTQYGEWIKLADVKGTTYTDNKAKSGVEYYYTIRAFGKTGYGGVDKSYPYMLYLEAPDITSVKRVNGAVRVEWEFVGCQGYYLYRKEAGGQWIRIYSVYSNSPYYEDTTAKKGVEYTYTVRSFVWDSQKGCLRSEYKPGVKFKY